MSVASNGKPPSILTPIIHNQIDSQLACIAFSDRGIILVHDNQTGQLHTFTQIKRRGILFALWLSSPRKRLYLSYDAFLNERAVAKEMAGA